MSRPKRPASIVFARLPCRAPQGDVTGARKRGRLQALRSGTIAGLPELSAWTRMPVRFSGRPSITVAAATNEGTCPFVRVIVANC